MEAAPASPRVVLLCAGASSRLGEPKALALIGGRRVLERLAEAARSVDPAPLVVTGKHHAEIEPVALELGLTCLRNTAWSEGRTGGLQLAAREAPGRDLLVSPADVPLVAPRTVRALAERWAAAGAPPEGWLAPAHAIPGERRRFGHPILIGRGLVAAPLEALGAGASLRQLREQAAPLLALDVDDPAILDDLDTPADLARLRARRPR